ncbi:MAG: alpha-E domain-containing protein [Nitrospirae bacterium]|nr:alpha-E domain-containing protein [Nitrospirota bacterium]
MDEKEVQAFGLFSGCDDKFCNHGQNTLLKSFSHCPVEISTRFLADVKANSHLFLGITDATMSHGEGWHFARLGRLLERADKTSRILDVTYFMLLPTVAEVGTPFDIIQWLVFLLSLFSCGLP